MSILLPTPPDFPIPLCVPSAAAGIATRIGARWSRDAGGYVLETPASALPAASPLRSFLPHRFRADREPPYLRPWMVPQPLWGWNLRAMLVPADWRAVRRRACEATGWRCRICGGRGETHPVEVDEGWAYDDENGVQTLVGVVALCPRCHAVRHWGRTVATGREADALHWLAWINRWSAEEARRCAAQAFALWHIRSAKCWRCEIGWVEQRFGFRPIAGAEAHAAAIQQRLVSVARGDVR